jgi:hypothetical protein
MSTPAQDAALVDAVARFHRGELAGEQATAVRAFLDNVAKIAAEHERSRAEYERTMRRFDLRLEAELKAVEAKQIARTAEALRIQAERA